MPLTAGAGNGPSDAFRAALVSLQRKAQSLEGQLATCEQGRSKVEHELTVMKGDLARAHTEKSMLLDRNRTLEERQATQVEALQKENKKAQDAVRELLREKSDQQSNLRSVEEECCQLRASVLAIKSELQTSISARQQLRSQILDAEKQGKQAGDQLKSLQALNDRMTGQLRDYETVANDRLNQYQHQTTKVHDLERKLASASADLDAAGKQAQALQQQAVQAMDVRHTMEQMKEVMSQQHSAQQKLMEEKAHNAAEQQQQLDSAKAQLHDRTMELQELRAENRCLKFQSGEESKTAQMRICTLESQLAEAQKQISLACSTLSRRMSSAAVGPACKSLCDSTLAQQLQEACAQAEHATEQLYAREHDIKVMQDCLDTERKDKEGVQDTLSSVLRLHNQLHVHLTKAASDVKYGSKGGKSRKAIAEGSRDTMLPPQSGSRRKQPDALLTACAQAAVAATSIKARNHVAVKTHVRRRKGDVGDEARDDSLSSRIARCAASGVTQAAEKACSKQARQERRALEKDYLNQYKMYKKVSEALRDSDGVDAAASAQLRQQLVSVMDTLNTQAMRLIGDGVHELGPWQHV